jgi:Flp pilus assembly protein TadG
LRAVARETCGRTAERGQSIAEFALILPFLLILVLGAVDYSRVYYQDVQVLHAARNGAAFASASTTNAANHTGIHDAALDGVTLPATPAVNDALVGDSSGGQSVQVSVQSQYGTLIAWPGLPHSITLKHTVEAKVLQ